MIAKKLKLLRERKGISQIELAEKLNIQQGSYSNYERGRRTPDIDALIRIANYYKVSTDYLLGQEKENESKLSKLERELDQKEKEKLYDIVKVMYPEECKKIDL